MARSRRSLGAELIVAALLLLWCTVASAQEEEGALEHVILEEVSQEDAPDSPRPQPPEGAAPEVTGPELAAPEELGTAEGTGQEAEQQLEQQQQQQPESEQQQEQPQPSLYDSGFSVVDIKGQSRQLSELKGKVALIVNVASYCGFTQSNYQLLQQVYEKYSISGLEILAFPCNQFGAQEPGTEDEIASFVETNYHVTFPLFSKVDVNGETASPLFQFLKLHTPPLEGHPANQDITWNFNKFLVDKWGRPVKRYGSHLVLWQLEDDIYHQLIRDYPGSGQGEAEVAPQDTKEEL